MIINLHGGLNFLTGKTSIYFADGSYGADALADSIRNRAVSPRALYATCCYGSYMIPAWEKTGITAVNGAAGTNTYVMFSPIYFLENWTKGMTYAEAEEASFNEEIEKIGSYQKTLSAVSELLTDDVKEESVRQIGGKNTSILWRNAR